MRLSLISASVLTLFIAATGAAQNASAALQSQSESSKPAPQAQPQPTSASSAQDPAKPADPKKKKVWTNENLSDANGTISVVGDPKNASKGKAAGKPADSQYIASLRKQLEKLDGEIADGDKQIADLTNFSKGETSTSTNGMKVGKGYNREPIDVQIHTLQEKKKELQAKIDELLDEARKKGVEPGQLR